MKYRIIQSKKSFIVKRKIFGLFWISLRKSLDDLMPTWAFVFLLLPFINLVVYFIVMVIIITITKSHNFIHDPLIYLISYSLLSLITIINLPVKFKYRKDAEDYIKEKISLKLSNEITGITEYTLKNKSLTITKEK